MRDIAIYGAGGLGREIACVLKRLIWLRQLGTYLVFLMMV